MARLIEHRDHYDIAFGNDPDYDRHGIVTRSAGLLNPNHYLAVAIQALFGSRPGWRADAAVGKTLVSSAMTQSNRAVTDLAAQAQELNRLIAELNAGGKAPKALS